MGPSKRSGSSSDGGGDGSKRMRKSLAEELLPDLSDYLLPDAPDSWVPIRAPRAVQLPPFLELPEALIEELLSFLRRWETHALRQLSRSVRGAMLPLVRKLRPCTEGDPRALLDLLQGAVNLRTLDTSGLQQGEVAARLLMGAIKEGSVGGRLEALTLGYSCYGSDNDPLDRLLEHLQAGLLPNLKVLDLSNWRLSEAEWGFSVAEALEARRELGLPPIRRLVGYGGMDDENMPRIWACCPPEEVEHLDAEDDYLVQDLSEFLLAHPSFPSLYSLHLSGGDYVWVDPREAPEYLDLTGVFQALAEGRAPALEELKLEHWKEEMGSLEPLVGLLAGGKLQALKTLDLRHFYLPSNWVFVSQALVAARGVRLRRLVVDKVAFSEVGWAQLASAVKAEGGALSELEELELLWRDSDDDEPWTAVAEALAAPAPCARTLRRLVASPDEMIMDQESVSAFLGALGRGDFPALRELEVPFWKVTVEAAAGFAQALLGLAARGAPCVLEELALCGGDHGDLMAALTPVFAAGGLPRLRHLEFVSSPGPIEELVGAWRALGDKIKLEKLTLHGFSLYNEPALKESLLEALADPRFCPSLRVIRTADGLVQWALDARWAKRAADAALAASGLASGAG